METTTSNADEQSVDKQPRKMYDVSHKELMKMVAKQTGYRLYEVEDVLNGLTYIIRKLLKDDKTFNFRGLGTFKIRKHAERYAYNPFRDEYLEHKGNRRIKVVFDRNLIEGVQFDSSTTSQ